MKIPSREDCDLFGVLSMNSEGNICTICECAPASCNPVCDSKDQKRGEPFFLFAGGFAEIVASTVSSVLLAGHGREECSASSVTLTDHFSP